MCVHLGVSRLVWSGQTVRCNVSEASLGLDRHLRGFSRSLIFNWSAATKCWYLSGFLAQRSDLGLWCSRGLLPRRRRVSGSRPTVHRALYRVVRDFTSQGSGQRVRRPDNISSAMLTVAFSQSHCSLVSVQHPWVSRVSEESPRLWVGFCDYATRFHRHARQMLGPLSVSEKGLTLVCLVSRPFSGEEEGRTALRSRVEPICHQVLGSTLVPLRDLQCPYGSRCRGFPSSHSTLSLPLSHSERNNLKSRDCLPVRWLAVQYLT